MRAQTQGSQNGVTPLTYAEECLAGPHHVHLRRLAALGRGRWQADCPRRHRRELQRHQLHPRRFGGVLTLVAISCARVQPSLWAESVVNTEMTLYIIFFVRAFVDMCARAHHVCVVGERETRENACVTHTHVYVSYAYACVHTHAYEYVFFLPFNPQPTHTHISPRADTPIRRHKNPFLFF